MKVTINDCFGGFGLSDKAVERCVELGMKLTQYGGNGYVDETADFVEAKDSHFGKYHIINDNDNAFRSNPIVVQVIEELGKEANDRFASLKIVDIPFTSTEGWHISEYDGSEQVEEDHRTWG